jgi:adenylate cyclase
VEWQKEPAKKIKRDQWLQGDIERGQYRRWLLARSGQLGEVRRHAPGPRHEAAQTAVALDPNAANGYYAMALAEGALKRREQSIVHIKQAFALSPRDPIGGLWHSVLGIDEGCLNRLDAIGEFKQAIDTGYRTFFPYAFLAAVEAAKGNDAEAKVALAEARRINPQLTIKWFAEHSPAPTLTVFVDGWRKVGLPEE